MKAIFTPEADDDLSSIYLYTYSGWGQQQADFYTSELKQKIVLLCQNPELGRVRRELPAFIRSLVYERHVIVYQTKPTDIQILRILHQSQDFTSQELTYNPR